MSRLYTIAFLSAGLLCAGNMTAAHLTPAQALDRVEQHGALRSASNKNLTHTATIGALYVFSSGDGYMILPADDRAPAVLGYADSGSLVTEGNPALTAWLEFYNRQLQYLSSRPEAPAFTVQKSAREAISPLIQTEWNQESPYNMLCPKVNGHDVVTGCVATAMAQFMKYYDYPEKGHGTHSYYWGVGGDTLSLDYDTIPFQWNLMTDTYNAQSPAEAKKAVAQLMVACGISVDMHYDIGDSGAATTHMGTSLIDIFGYSPSLWMAHRDFYGYDEWVRMVYDELAAGRPVLYSGQGTAGGHQFICDGYSSDDYFHFNWGWGGLSNGYFLLTALNPSDLGVGGGAGGFNTDQVATFNGRPAETGDEPTYLMYNTEGFTTDATTVSAGDDLACGGLYFNFSMQAFPAESYLGMKFTNADTKAAEFVRGPDVSGYHLDDGRYNDVVKFPSLADGTYIITPSLRAGDKWWEVRSALGQPGSITAVVKDGVATLTSGTAATVTVSDITVPEVVYVGYGFPLSFTVSNTGSLEYYANITPYMLDSEGTAVASSTYRPVDVLPGAEEKVTDYVGDFKALDGQTFGAGDYNLVFRDGAGTDISSPLAVHVDTTSVATSIKVTELHIITATPVTDPTKVEFGFTIECEAGVYYSCPSVLIFPGDGGYDLASVSGDYHYLTSGQTAEATVTGDLSALKDGEYMAAAFADGEQKTGEIWFAIKRTTTGLDVTVTDGASRAIYRLDGIRATEPLSPGLYIIDGRLTLIK